jgi:branched-chain amino acid aminotransferase
VGITRQVVLDLCRDLPIPAVERTVLPPELYQADECFLTGTAAEVIAVTKIDGKIIGSGKSGPVTNRLLRAFREFIRTTRA